VELARIASEDGQQLRLVAVQGEIDITNVDALERAVLAVVNSQLGAVLDLAGMTYLDSAGVRALFSLEQRLRDRGQLLAVAAPDGEGPRRVLELTGFTDAGCVCSSREEALGRVRAHSAT
jgi:stage II sporulation protein AA (anti-sigma F factor antagonist)